jgi:hypothetical protein
MQVYTEISIQKHHSGFGMYQTGELQVSPQTSYADFGDLCFEIAQNSEAMGYLSQALEDEEFIAAGVEDIAGRIYNQPEKLFARINDGQLNYFGIVESEVPDDFFAA